MSIQTCLSQQNIWVHSHDYQKFRQDNQKFKQRQKTKYTIVTIEQENFPSFQITQESESTFYCSNGFSITDILWFIKSGLDNQVKHSYNETIGNYFGEFDRIIGQKQLIYWVTLEYISPVMHLATEIRLAEIVLLANWSNQAKWPTKWLISGPDGLAITCEQWDSTQVIWHASWVLTAIDSQGHVRVLPTYSRAHLETSQVPVRDTHAMVKFELNCTVQTHTHIHTHIHMHTHTYTCIYTHSYIYIPTIIEAGFIIIKPGPR